MDDFLVRQGTQDLTYLFGPQAHDAECVAGRIVRQSSRQFRPLRIDIERFRASADGHLPQEWLPIAPLEWSAFALHAAAAKAAVGSVADEELTAHVRHLLDRMVREAQHRGLAFDEDED